jgi:hydrocephalus-inducing protein
MGIGVYAEEENKFIFNNVIVGRTAKARLKILNVNKMPIDVSMSLKSSSSQKQNSKSTAAGYSSSNTANNISSSSNSTNNNSSSDSQFELEPARCQIMPHSYAYATVSFTPNAMQSYATYFEAQLENVSNSLKNKSVHFEIQGEGNLPRFSILKPALKNKRGQALMIFKRCIMNHVDSQLLVLSNDGTLAAKVNFFLSDPDKGFKIRPVQEDGIVLNTSDNTISSCIIQPGAQAQFHVTCAPKFIQPYQASLQLTVTDNQFEDTMIQMIGEGYMEDVTLENLHSLSNDSSDLLNLNSNDEFINDEDLQALKFNSISFGDVYMKEKKQLLFTMKNQSKSDVYRFEWPANQQEQTSAVQFSPRVGHLHAGCAKDITVSFKSSESKFMRKDLHQCALTKILFEQNVNDVKDWDDRVTIVKWINEIVAPNEPNQTQSNTIQLPQQEKQTHHNINSRMSDDAATLTSISLASNTQSNNNNNNKQGIVRKKVVETEPEPKHSKLDGENVQPIELYISANCDYCRYRCKTNAIRFKDTLMFQTRVFEVTVANKGKYFFFYFHI